MGLLGRLVIEVQYDFSGQTAVITGGSRGIGRAVAAQFVRFGAQVYIWDADPIELPGATSLIVDVSRSDQVAEAVTSVEKQANAH